LTELLQIADGGDIWKYVNPDLNIEPVIPNRPKRLALQEINASKTTIVALNPTKRDAYKILLSIYKDDFAVANKVLNTI
jgi:hypothetical protein